MSNWYIIERYDSARENYFTITDKEAVFARGEIDCVINGAMNRIAKKLVCT